MLYWEERSADTLRGKANCACSPSSTDKIRLGSRQVTCTREEYHQQNQKNKQIEEKEMASFRPKSCLFRERAACNKMILFEPGRTISGLPSQTIQDVEKLSHVERIIQCPFVSL